MDKKIFLQGSLSLNLLKLSKYLQQSRPFCLTKSNRSLMNLWLKCFKLFSPKFLTEMANKELKNWKLSINTILLLKLKRIYFCNPFGMTFILKSNIPGSCITRCVSHFFRFWNKIWFYGLVGLDITIYTRRTSIVFSDMTAISYF